jgi:pullulanase/glycogen debranching enzyme
MSSTFNNRYYNVTNKINNLDWLDKSENYYYKSFFYIHINAKIQEEIIKHDNKTFIKELDKLITQHNRKIKIEEINNNFLTKTIKKILTMFKKR